MQGVNDLLFVPSKLANHSFQKLIEELHTTSFNAKDFGIGIEAHKENSKERMEEFKRITNKEKEAKRGKQRVLTSILV